MIYQNKKKPALLIQHRQPYLLLRPSFTSTLQTKFCQFSPRHISTPKVLLPYHSQVLPLLAKLVHNLNIASSCHQTYQKT